MVSIKTICIVLIVITIRVSGKCRIQPLSARSNIPSDTILSGTVKSFYMKESGGPFAGKVKVRRVFRGDTGLEGRMVMVEGFGNKNICLSSPRLGDTKLFFLKNIKPRQNIYPRVYNFKLNDNILKLNLRNLKTLWKLEDTNTKGSKKLII